MSEYLPFRNDMSLCLKHHREWHKNHDKPELLEGGKK